MPLEFRHVRYEAGGLFLEVDLSFGDGMIVGLVGPNGAGKAAFLQLAAGSLKAQAGTVECGGPVALAAASLDSADPTAIRQSLRQALEADPQVLLAGPSLVLTDLDFQNLVLAEMHKRRRAGSIVVLASHDLGLLERHSDEVVVLEGGRVVERGDPQMVLRNYRDRCLERQRGAASAAGLQPSSRHGDRRAEVAEVQILGANGQPTGVIQSGESVRARVLLRFLEAVENPVVGILIRSRIGVNVYGTNTELEKVQIGPCAAGDEIELSFRFAAHLCPQEYTLTVASHDPDGTAHDWLEDAIFFTVTDSRDTAGVANLRAQVDVRRK